ncbi:MAG: GNAT family N-acetyltransferase [Clostridiales bacterium]|nr:GNAT family N-acetyltransferase [Clostridiales bacterium]
MYIEGKFITYPEDLKEVYSIRREVFIEEQNIPETEEFDEYDKKAIFCVLYEENNSFNTQEKMAVATGRLVLLEDGSYKIGRIAVRKQFRGLQYGDMLVKMLVNKAFISGAKEVYVGAQIQAKGFYQKIGFKEIGDEYLESNIPHIKMVLLPQNICKKCKNI